MNHNFGLHLGITTHLEKIYGAPSFESWCDIKTKVKRGKKLGINYYPQSHMYLPVQQVKVWGFRNTANNYHGCWNKVILLKVVGSKKKKNRKEKFQQKSSLVHVTGVFNFSFVYVCPSVQLDCLLLRVWASLQSQVPLRGHTFLFSIKRLIFGPVHALNRLLQ